MKLYFIKCEYKIEEDQPVIYIWGRNLETYEKVMFRVSGHEPDFFVLESEQVPNIPQIKKVQHGYKSIFSESLKRIVVGIPDDVKDIKNLFSKHFQADIPFTRHFLIYRGIRKYFIVPDGKTELDCNEIHGE